MDAKIIESLIDALHTDVCEEVLDTFVKELRNDHELSIGTALEYARREWDI